MRHKLHTLKIGVVVIAAAVGSFFLNGPIMAIVATVGGSICIWQAATWDEKHPPRQTKDDEPHPPITR